MNEITENKNKIKVYWDDLPENYSKEIKNRITTYFSNKYKVAKNNVTVVFRPIRKDKYGNTVEISDAGVDNIMDINYQRELMKKWVEINEKKVDFTRIVKLDDKVNKDVNFSATEKRHKRWGINWLEINNFLSFGDNNRVNFEKLNGLNIVNSIPENQGGKTTFNVDAVKFLLFGKTTKTDKNEEIFNTFRSNNELLVKGELSIDPHNVVIERKMVRKEKKDGGWTISNTVNFFQVMPDGSHEKLNEEDATSTTKQITEAVGKESDFDITTLATANNLENLIEFKPTENGKLLNRFIGLEIIDEKLDAVRKQYNTFNAKKLGNLYNVITLQDEIEDLATKKESLGGIQNSQLEKLKEVNTTLTDLVAQKETLIGSKILIDDDLLNVNIDTLEKEKNGVITKGETIKPKKAELKKEIKELGKIVFDEDEHNELTKRKHTNENTVRSNNSDIQSLEKTNESLINSENCHACKRPLKGVDNSSEVKLNEVKIVDLKTSITELTKANGDIEVKLETLNLIKANVDKKNRLELSLDRLEVELGSLRNEYTRINNLLKAYNLNKDGIDRNRKIDGEISVVKTKITVEETTIETLNQKLNNIKIELSSIDKDVENKTENIKKIKKEEEVERIYKLYIEMYGKKGIGKMVLRSILPIINSELIRLMEDICDFTIELEINGKNDIEYVLIKDEIRKSLKSGSGLEKTIASIALRAVLGKMAYLPMPNFITFDEVLGKVAEINIEKMKDIFDKIKELYDRVFFITHNPIVKDWGDNIITIKKDNNVSSINIE